MSCQICFCLDQFCSPFTSKHYPSGFVSQILTHILKMWTFGTPPQFTFSVTTSRRIPVLYMDQLGCIGVHTETHISWLCWEMSFQKNLNVISICCWQIKDTEDESKEMENLKLMAKEAMGAVFSAVDSVSTCSGNYCLSGLSGYTIHLESGKPGFDFHFSMETFLDWVIPVSSECVLQWLPCQASGDIGSVVGLVDPLSVYYGWGWEFDLQLSVWQHIKLFELVRPWETICCWEVKQPTKRWLLK